MIKLNASQQNKLKKAGIVALFLFGSKALKIDGPLSDTDIAVLLNNRIPDDQILRKSAEYESQLINILPNIKDIEVTLLNSAPIGLQATVLKEGKLLFCSDYQKLVEFKEKTIIKASDLLPFLHFFLRDRLNNFYAHTT